MSELGSIGKTIGPWDVTRVVSPEVDRSARVLGEHYILRPLATVVDDPIPSAGVRAVQCHSKGVLRFERAVLKDKTVTVTVKVRKTALYMGPFTATVRGELGWRQLAGPYPSLRPFLRITRSDGLVATNVMPDTVDTWQELSVAMAILVDGGLLIELVQAGSFVPRSTIGNVTSGARCFWADLKASES